MSRKSRAICLSVVIGLLVFCFSRISIFVEAEKKIWIVDDDEPADFQKIQDAINNASSGDEIYVRNGLYYERLAVNKSVVIRGENKFSTIIDGGNYESVVRILANNVTLKGFTVRHSGTSSVDSGVLMVQASNAVISDNFVIENNNGISLHFSNDTLISNNYVASNNLEGVKLYSSTRSLVLNNTIENNMDGIYVYSSWENVIRNNIIFQNVFCGMYLSLSVENYFVGNSIYSSGAFGVYLSFTNENVFYHNNFNNTSQIWSNGNTNFWDFGKEGNYWSGYSGTDSNLDGIGDLPFMTEVNNWDNFPLMGKFSDFQINFEGKEYNILTISNWTISALSFNIGSETGNRIILFNITGSNNSTFFFRITFPSDLMTYPYIVLIDGRQVTPSSIKTSDGKTTLYVAHVGGNYTVRIISSEVMRRYEELLNNYTALQKNFVTLNLTYYNLMNNYSVLLSAYTQLQVDFDVLNQSYQQLAELNSTYYALLDNYTALQNQFHELNLAHYNLVTNYVALQNNFDGLNSTYVQLTNNYNVLLTAYGLLNASYYAQMRDVSEQTQNLRNMTYAVSAVIGIMLVAVVYLSKQAHARSAKSRVESAEKTMTSHQFFSS
ncbi:MAG: NosD domain-containing protein [Candidatus Bathyarchaeia archaeon]